MKTRFHENHRRLGGTYRARRLRGFTLIEVLASVAILAIVIPFAMRAASTASMLASLSRHRAEAATLAEAKLADLVVEQTYHRRHRRDFCADGVSQLPMVAAKRSARSQSDGIDADGHLERARTGAFAQCFNAGLFGAGG